MIDAYRLSKRTVRAVMTDSFTDQFDNISLSVSLSRLPHLVDLYLFNLCQRSWAGSSWRAICHHLCLCIRRTDRTACAREDSRRRRAHAAPTHERVSRRGLRELPPRIGLDIQGPFHASPDRTATACRGVYRVPHRVIES